MVRMCAYLLPELHHVPLVFFTCKLEFLCILSLEKCKTKRNLNFEATPNEIKEAVSAGASLTVPSLHSGASCTSCLQTLTALGGSALGAADETWCSSPHKTWNLEGPVSLGALDGSAGKNDSLLTHRMKHLLVATCQSAIYPDFCLSYAVQESI